ncbi:MAG TPA: hypothetical protein VK638_35595, partial [Edaphobacter sp.]|nr:hypothetical protein [Edaphobacter sp.]
DTATMVETLAEAGEQVADLIAREAAKPEPGVNLAGIEEAVADKGYHRSAVLVAMKAAAIRTYIPEKKQAGKRHWMGKKEEQQAVYANRRRVPGPYGKSLLRKRGEWIERSVAHCYDTGAMRRTQSARPQEHPQAAADSPRRLQSQPDFPFSDRRRHAAGAEKPPRLPSPRTAKRRG